MDQRIANEKAFHDDVGNLVGREKAAGKFYSIDIAARSYYEQELCSFDSSLQVLEYGCGAGSYAPLLASRGYRVTGIDLSPNEIRRARSSSNLQDPENPKFLVMNAEALAFSEESFGGICGTGILHHLNIERACEEISRALVPGGTGVFLEPLGHNPLINLYRALTPSLRTSDEHPLVKNDIALMRRHFREVRCRYFYLTTFLALPFRRLRGFRSLVRSLDTLDRGLFKTLPFLRIHSWVVVLSLVK
jgi:SAM-dependent methyltransferase